MKQIQTIITAALALSTIFATIALANVQTFKISGELNSATVESNTTVENLTGRTDKVTNEIRFNPQAKTGSGVSIIDAMSISTDR